MTIESTEQSIHSIQETLDKVIQASKDLDETTLRFKPSEDEWSIMQVLCHIAEAVPYWLKEIQMVVASPGSEWGRGLQDKARLAAVELSTVNNKEISAVLDELEKVKGQVQKGLGDLTKEQLAMEAPSKNPRFGTKPLSFIVDHLLVEHVSKHLSQIERNLSKI